MHMKSVYIEPWPTLGKQFCYIGGNHWSVARLIELSKELEVYEVPLKFLELDRSYSYRPREFVTHMHAVMNANLDYPIILDEDGVVMDGRHRILKALFLGRQTIMAVRFDKNPSPCKTDD